MVSTQRPGSPEVAVDIMSDSLLFSRPQASIVNIGGSVELYRVTDHPFTLHESFRPTERSLSYLLPRALEWLFQAGYHQLLNQNNAKCAY